MRSASTEQSRSLAVERVELRGEYDLARKEELAAFLAAVTGTKPVVLDMTRVSYVDSSFLNELSHLRSRLQNSQITLQGVNAQLRRVLSLMRFDSIFDIEDGQPG